MSSQIHCTLTENALDYLLFADELARLSHDDKRGESHKLKHALATLADGMELLLKARVEAAGWEHLFADPTEANRDAYESGDFVSISIRDLPQVLRDRCGVKLRSRQRKLLNRLANQRNKIRHFAISIDLATVASLTARAFSFALDFIHEELQGHKNDLSFAQDVALLREALGRNQDFVAERLRRLRALTDDETAIAGVTCPECDQQCLCTDGEAVACRFCRQQNTPERTALDLAYAAGMRMKEIASETIAWECPECHSQTCVKSDSSSDTHVCLSCGEACTYSHCERCGGLFVPEPFDDEDNESWICDECEEQAMESD